MMFELNPIVSIPFLLVILSLILLVGAAPIFLLARKNHDPKRLLLKAGLFLGFWICLALALLRPQLGIDSEESRILVYSSSLDKVEIDFWKDSLQVKKAIPLQRFSSGESDIFLLGADFSEEDLFPIRKKKITWILPRKHGQLQDISWKGAIRKGELQRLTYTVFSDRDSAYLKVLSVGSDSIQLQKGWNQGTLEFFNAGVGETNLPLILDRDTLTSVRYFTAAASPKQYFFKLGFPSGETRTLTNWLREKGEHVNESIQLSRSSYLQSGAGDSLQVLIADPSQMAQKQVQEWVKEENTALLLVQLSDPRSSSQEVNKLFGTDFQAEATGDATSRTFANGMEALPFRWKEQSGQKTFHEGSVAIQDTDFGKIAITMVQASFPLLLEGKEETYEEFWGDVIGALEPVEAQSFNFSAPVLKGFESQIQLFNQDSLPSEMSFGNEVVFVSQSLINPSKASGKWTSAIAGWNRRENGPAYYSYTSEELPSIFSVQLIQSINQGQVSTDGNDLRRYQPISPWIWMLGMLLFLGAMWLEPKLKG